MCPSAERSERGPAARDDRAPGFDALEEAIARALRQLDVWRRRAVAADAERRQLRAWLDEIKTADRDPVALARECARLREENAALRARIAEARARAEGIEKRLLFLEDARR